jgi:8-oxo-dGTP pyrophosphatase MutT (NUDIX family)
MSSEQEVNDAAAPARGDYRPDVTVACVIERDGRFLLVEERAQDQLVVNQPAGHVDPDETLVAAALRETLEETGWMVRPLGLIAVYQWRSPEAGIDFLRFTLAAEPLSEVAGHTLDRGIERTLWLSADELDSGRHVLRSPMVSRSVADYRRRAPLPLEVLSFISGPDPAAARVVAPK